MKAIMKAFMRGGGGEKQNENLPKLKIGKSRCAAARRAMPHSYMCKSECRVQLGACMTCHVEFGVAGGTERLAPLRPPSHAAVQCNAGRRKRRCMVIPLQMHADAPGDRRVMRSPTMAPYDCTI